MAATNYTVQLYESKGLCRIIHFSGLEFDLIINPYVYGEPLVTTQPICYLEDLESIAQLRVEHPRKISERETEYLIDNYLFKYSLLNEESKICSKITNPKFWMPDFSEFHQLHDNRLTGALTLDYLNDKSIVKLADLDGSDWYPADYCFPKEFIDAALTDSAKKIKELFKKKILVKINPDNYRDGYYGKIRLLQREGTLIDYTQAQSLESIGFHNIKNDYFNLKSWIDDDVVSLPIEKIMSTEKFSPTLLSYYFSGLRERNPLLSFIGFYNVLENYLEEAPVLLGKTPTTEKINLRSVIDLITDTTNLYNFLSSSSHNLIKGLSKEIGTSSGVKISGITATNDPSLLHNLSDWIYTIRCAVVHSKKSRKGKTEAIFEPYSVEADNIVPSLEVVKWLAQQCILKDHGLANPQPTTLTT
ncbi:hypothetical protein OGV89_13095 [Citrobacter sp. Cf125]|uniref:hypothetical protein n=1 Tax=Citrobacter sp. Cf125 TaxID=2985075 RepID=UPI0025789885|nr:hypothetical protein [Citrobacter sp. Cf125]MDM3122725.1 hypothetical protein [Citrobacter sp. Cf125]